MRVRGLKIACAIVCWSHLAVADGVGVIAVGGDRVAVAAAMAKVIAGRSVADAVAEARAAIAAGAVPVETLQRFRRVREEIDEGWRAYNRVAIEFAASRLATARTDAEALVALPGGAELYADASLRLGAVLGHLGRGPEAQAALALALALDPERPIEVADFPPDVLDAVAAVRAIPAVAQRVHVAIEPAGALVTIDGKEVGAAPLELDVARGQHVVVARAPLYRTAVKAVAIDEGASVVQLGLDRDELAAQLATGAAGLADAAAQELIDSAMQFTNVDEAVLVASTDRRGGPTLLVQRCAGVPARCSAVVELGYGAASGLASAAREAWQAALGGELRYPPTVLGERDTGPSEHHRCEVCRSPWLWGSVAAAAVVGTIVVIAIVSSSKPAPIVGLNPTDFTHP